MKESKTPEVLTLDRVCKLSTAQSATNLADYGFELLRKTGKAGRFRLKVLDLACYNLRIRYLEW
ncbi:MAG: hypothetical protein C0469_03900 [Cyanobacteria bacterium DS2.3.42]|nr:hypothetical protein [Cyanobacteria bacterium DS2.3.42]